MKIICSRESGLKMKCFIVLLFLASLLYASGELTDFQLFEEEVHGVYRNDNGSLGIIFTCRRDFLLVETLTGKLLVHLDSFREIDSNQGISRRSVNVLNQTYYHHKDLIHSHLDGPVYNNTQPFDDTLREMLAIPEIRLLEDVSRAVGELGVTGRNTPAVMPFFMFSLRVGQLLEEDLMPPPQRKKRLFLLAATLRIINDHNHRTTYNYHTASPKICYQYRWTDECIGLCGIKCRCAKWVCGDCCFHGGCAAQDYCCKRIGYFRCMFGYHTNFSCDGVAACSGLTCCQ